MKIDKTTPERIIKDPESARQKESEKRRNMGVTFSFFVGMTVLALFYFYPEMMKTYSIAAYDFINHVAHYSGRIQ